MIRQIQPIALTVAAAAILAASLATAQTTDAGTTEPSDGATANAPEERLTAPEEHLTGAAAGNHTSGVVEPAVFVFIESDPNDAAKFEQYRDVPEGFVLPHFQILWEKNLEPFAGGMFFELDAVDAVQKDQRIHLNFGSRGLWKGKLSWTENPKRYGDGAHMLYSYQGDGVFTLPDPLQSAVQAGAASGGNNNQGDTAPNDLVWDAGTKGAILRDALADAPEIDVEYQRKTGRAEFEFTPTKAWRLGFSAEREKRDGTKPQSQSVAAFNPVVELAAPVDFQTDTFSGFAEYSRKHWVLGARYTVSDFEIGQDRILFDSPVFLADTLVGTTTNPGHGQYSLGADNNWSQWQLYFGASLPGHTRINATASGSHATQDDDFLPHTVNSLISGDPKLVLPVSSADAEYDNGLLDLRINSRPLDWLRLKAWWRDYEHDTDTPEYVFPAYAETDLAVADSRRNLAYGYDKENLGALVGFGPADWVEIGLSFEREDMTRERAAVEDSSEDTWKLLLDFDVNEHLFLRASYAQQDRRAHEYHIHYHEVSFPDGEANVAPINEGSRKFYWTDRDREKWSLLAQITPIQQFTIYAEAIHADSKYKDPETGQRIGTSYEVMEDRNADGTDETYDILLAGRTKDDTTSYTLGFAINPNDDWDIYVDHTWESVDWSMASRYRNISGGIGTDNPLDNWFTDVEDSYRTLTLGFHGTWAEGRWEVRGDLAVTHATGDILTDFVDGGAASGDTDLTKFPQLDNDFTVATLAFERHLASGWDVGFQYWYEKWTYDDWQNDYNAPYIGNPNQERGASTWIQLGNDFDDYENHILSVLARYKF